MVSIFRKIIHAQSGCLSCAVVFVPDSGHTSGGFNDVRISAPCRKALEKEAQAEAQDDEQEAV